MQDIFQFREQIHNCQGSREIPNLITGALKFILGSIKQIIQGARKKGPNFKGSRNLGTPPPLQGLKYDRLNLPTETTFTFLH